MAKLSLEEFKNKYNEKITDNDDLLIELFEDASDSFSNDEVLANLQKEIANKEAEIEELKMKYKERFLTSTSDEVQEEKTEETLEEKEVIDIKEI